MAEHITDVEQVKHMAHTN